MAVSAQAQKTAGSVARMLRRRESITLDTLATQLNLSKGHLSRFERGEKALSVMSLLRLADALGTSVGRLFGEALDDDDIHVVHASDIKFKQTGKSEGEYRYAILSGKGDHGTFLVELEHGKQHEAHAFHAGVELLFLRCGSLRVTLGDKVFSLEAGDYMEFPGSTPHRIESLTPKTTFLVVVI